MRQGAEISVVPESTEAPTSHGACPDGTGPPRQVWGSVSVQITTILVSYSQLNKTGIREHIFIQINKSREEKAFMECQRVKVGVTPGSIPGVPLRLLGGWRCGKEQDLEVLLTVLVTEEKWQV